MAEGKAIPHLGDCVPAVTVWYNTHRAARIGRNPRSGESVAVPGKRTVRFKPGKVLREAADERRG